MLKARFWVITGLVWLSVGFGAGLAYASGVKVLVNEKELSFDVPPVIEEGRTLVPLRAIFEALGAEVDWDGDTKTVTATKGAITISLTIGEKTAYKNGGAVVLDVPGRIIEGRTLVPLRFVSEALGAEVEWEASTRTVTITSGESSGSEAVHFSGSEVVHFKDPALEAAVREALGKETGDITAKEMAGLSELDASDRGIQDLSGLEYATNLRVLHLSKNKISDISPFRGWRIWRSLILTGTTVSATSRLW